MWGKCGGATRKSFYLTVEQMTELYNCFLEKRYPEEWDVDWKENTHYSLGLFLVQYLGNGFNLADAAYLTYNDHYFQSGKKSFQFVRQKTEDRSDNEVFIPIIPPLQTILDQIAAHGADTLSQPTSLMPEFLITTYPRVWATL